MIKDKNFQLNNANFNQLESLNKNLQLLEMPTLVTGIFKLITDLHSKHDTIKEFLEKFSDSLEIGDRYLTPQDAMNYLGFSKNTFDKYRYTTKVKIKGYQLDGKAWFKKSDLDRFMMSYEAKSAGFA